MRHERPLLYAVLAVGLVVRALMIVGSPTSFGYVYDFYPEAVAYVYQHHALPPPDACWICAHPPLFWIVGTPFYALGMWLSGGRTALAEQLLCVVPLACDALTVLYTYRLLRLYRQRGLFLLSGVALCTFFPCLVISSHGPESDILLTALMLAGLFYLCRLHLQPARSGLFDALALGALCGLALLTKYSGALLPIAAGAVLGHRWLRGPQRRRTQQQAAAVFALALALGGTKYAYNLGVHHELLVANGSARSGFDVFRLGERSANLRYYDFYSLKLNEAALLFAPGHGGGTLTAQPVYASVWTTLHAMAWTDMSFFSVHARHGDPRLPYPQKRVSVPLVRLLLYLGLVPTVLCMVGAVSSGFRRSLWPLSFFALSSFSTYLWWFLAQDCWALKTKYLLFLLPVYVLFALLGLHRALRVCGRFGGGIALVSVALLSTLLVTCVAYLTSFALG